MNEVKRWRTAEEMTVAIERLGPDWPKRSCIQHDTIHDPTCSYCLRATIVGLKPWKKPTDNMRSPHED